MNPTPRLFSFGCRLCLALAVAASWFSSVAFAAEFARGADVGWLSEMESRGVTFRNASGAEADCLTILQNCGINSIRLRVWVDPKDGWCGKDDVVKMAVRAKDRGFRLMIDFHYSDWWADPGKQTKPAAWQDHGIEQLKTDVRDHTLEVLRALKAAGVSPEWIQIGNETNNGMLWPDGRASEDMAGFAGLITSGYDAAKSVFPEAVIIVHISNGYDGKLFRWMFDGLTANHAKFDAIGMSLYPTRDDWPKLTRECLANMQDMIARYGKDIVISEVGMEVSAPEACRDFVADIIAKTKSLPDHRGLGVFYWEPECHADWVGYTKGAFAPDGRPTAAMDAFKP
ncbi:MAG TPA: glycosyl hydrolase 53 family protein [Opitutus sp.]|nr:glycosyl hydrolase 53 family protein [Opitutus sp.]